MKKTLYKALTYKALSMTVTVAVTMALTGSFWKALSMGFADAVFKMGLFMVNETAWEKFSKKGFKGAMVAMVVAVASMCGKEAKASSASAWHAAA